MLNHNDCRHYVNTLVNRATGFSCASVQLVRHHFEKRRDQHVSALEHLLRGMQHVTDVDNWGAVQRTMHAAAVAAPVALGLPAITATFRMVRSLPLGSLPSFIRPLTAVNVQYIAMAMPMMHRNFSRGALVAAASVPFVKDVQAPNANALWRHVHSLASNARQKMNCSLNGFAARAGSSQLLERLRLLPTPDTSRARMLPVASLAFATRGLCASTRKLPVRFGSHSLVKLQGGAERRRMPVLMAHTIQLVPPC